MTNKQASYEQIIDSILKLFSDGQIQEALNSLNQLSKEYPNDSLLSNIRGACYTALGKFDLAIKSYNTSIELNPEYADAFYNLGNTYKEVNQLKDAIKAYKKTLAIDSNYITANFNLAVTLHEMNEFYEACDYYEQLLDIDPNNIDARTNLGNIYQNLEQFEDAIYQYEKVLDIDPESHEAFNNLGTVHREMGQSQKAIIYYKEAIKINPQFSGAYYNLGFTFQDLGYVEEAINQYERAIAINNHTWSHHNLSYLKKYKINDPQIEKMKSLLANNNLNRLDLIHLNLALARVYENLDIQDEFFKHLNIGNSLRKEELDYSIDQSIENHSMIKEIFQSPIPSISYPKSKNLSGKKPIFILGMPRSGTSLIEQILSSHNDVYGAGELETITRLTSPIVRNFSNGDIKLLAEEAIIFIRQEYEEMLSRIKTTKLNITDKLPLNFQFIGFIIAAFPDAKIVHLKRDARATCWSNYKHFFTSSDNAYSHNLDDLVAYYKLYREMMDFWHKLYPDKIYDLCYENLTTDQEKETRKLLEYCNLEWDENCLNFHENKRAVKTPSTLQVRKKIYTGSSDAWKKHWAYIQPMVDGLKLY